jgi:hypothetical protein
LACGRGTRPPAYQGTQIVIKLVFQVDHRLCIWLM